MKNAISFEHNTQSFSHTESPDEKFLPLLNELLEAERAGARVTSDMGNGDIDEPISRTLYGVSKDEAQFCAMLIEHIRRLGGNPSRKTGNFYGKVLALETFDDRLDLLNKGQAWVARKLRKTLPEIENARLKRDLKNMLVIHDRNIQSCETLCK